MKIYDEVYLEQWKNGYEKGKYDFNREINDPTEYHEVVPTSRNTPISTSTTPQVVRREEMKNYGNKEIHQETKNYNCNKSNETKTRERKIKFMGSDICSFISSGETNQVTNKCQSKRVVRRSYVFQENKEFTNFRLPSLNSSVMIPSDDEKLIKKHPESEFSPEYDSRSCRPVLRSYSEPNDSNTNLTCKTINRKPKNNISNESPNKLKENKKPEVESTITMRKKDTLDNKMVSTVGTNTLLTNWIPAVSYCRLSDGSDRLVCLPAVRCIKNVFQ